jgi:hypothetical protein
MPLVDDVISQLGKSAWFIALDLQLGFWQIRMASEDVKKTALSLRLGYMTGLSCPLVSKMPLVPSPEQCHWSSRNWEANS